MVTAKCLPVLYLVITFADLDLDSGLAEAPQAAGLHASDEGARSFSAAASRSSRVRAQSAASTVLRQAISRSPGEVFGS
jgi:hypothetical protein